MTPTNTRRRLLALVFAGGIIGFTTLVVITNRNTALVINSLNEMRKEMNQRFEEMRTETNRRLENVGKEIEESRTEMSVLADQI